MPGARRAILATGLLERPEGESEQAAYFGTVTGGSLLRARLDGARTAYCSAKIWKATAIFPSWACSAAPIAGAWADESAVRALRTEMKGALSIPEAGRFRPQRATVSRSNLGKQVSAGL